MSRTPYVAVAKMQLFLRRAGASSTHVVEAEPHDCFQSLLDRVTSSCTAATSGEVVRCNFLCNSIATFAGKDIRHLIQGSDQADGTASLQTFESQGRIWPKQTSLYTAGVQAGDFIALYQRLRGGGGDGGSTGAESRSSFLEMYATKKAAKVPHGRFVSSIL